jgi:sigma-E factor negative regulatory protein RseC
MDNYIKHLGIIEDINGEYIGVKITQSTSCAACKVAAHCNASESKEKIIDVYSNASEYDVGQTVIVSTTKTSAKLALQIGFILPLIILIAAILAFKLLKFNDETAAIYSLLLLIPYYLIVYSLRNWIEKDITFTLSKAE